MPGYIIEEEYSIKGINESDEFPYINHLSTLKEALEIARNYPDICKDGYATHVTRTANAKGQGQHVSCLTHRYAVRSDGTYVIIQELRTDDELIKSAKEDYRRDKEPLSFEEIEHYQEKIDELKKNMNFLIHTCRVARKAGFRFLHFASYSDYTDNSNILIQRILGVECEDRVIRHFQDDINKLSDDFSKHSGVPRLKDEMRSELYTNSQNIWGTIAG